jgi:hypothetical protein
MKLSRLFLLASLLTFTAMDLAAQHRSDAREVRLPISAARMPDRPWQQNLAEAPVWRAFIQEHPGWQVEFNEGTGLPHRAYGPPITVPGASPEQRADDFLRSLAGRFGIPWNELQRSALRATSKGVFVHYEQMRQGIPVIAGHAMVKLDAQQRVIAFALDVLPVGASTAQQLVDLPQAVAIAGSGLAQVERSESMGLRWLPIPAGRSVDVRLVWELRIESRDKERPQQYQCWVDATSGALLHRQDLVSDLRSCMGDHADEGADIQVNGTVYTTSPLAPAEVVGLRDLRVSISGNTLYTDTDGFLASGVAAPTTAQLQLRGRWANVSTNGATPSTSAFLQEGLNTISFDATSTIRQRTAYHHVNLVHEHMQQVLPAFTGMDIALPTKVDLTTDNCNAFYDGSSINFYAEGGGCRAMANLRDVVYHEYGHGINDKFYQELSGLVINAAMSEGYADVWAWSLTGDPVIAAGYRLSDPLSHFRRYDEAPRVYPVDIVGQRHADGQIISGAWWDTYVNLGNDMGAMLQLFADALPGLQATAINGQEGVAFRDVLLDVLQADDDDGDITNGTPNGTAIVQAFARHGITLLTSGEIVHEALADQPVGAAIPVQATVLAPFPSSLYLGDVTLHYRINDGAWEQSPMSTQGASVYEATLPFAPSGTVIAYYLSVSDSNGEVGIVHPKGAALDPANLPHFVLVGYTLNASETAESVGGLGAFQPGVPGDNATGGQWALGVPIPSYAQQGIPSSIVQPGTQHTPGGQNCWFTGNAVGPEAATGANDVDAGTTTLRSALFDASALQNPVISYWRWYVNNAAEGTNPGTDPWTVSISNDGGGSWVAVESTPVSDRSWRRVALRIADVLTPTSSMRLQFQASDSLRNDQPFSGASLVEAAVDDVELWEAIEMNVGVETDLTADTWSLYPVPADERMELRFTEEAGFRELEIVDLSGRRHPARMLSGSAGSRSCTIDVSGLVEGHYLLQVVGEAGREVRRFSVIHPR